MKAIRVRVDFSEWEKVEGFISEINSDKEMAAYSMDNVTMIIAATGECAMAYAQAMLITCFDEPNVEIIK